MGLTAGDRVLVPHYHCGSEIDPLVRLGLDLDFYRVGPDLSPDIEHLRALLQKPARALWITHFFGFPQPLGKLIEIAHENSMFLLEDATHGLFSRDASGAPLGSRGDMSVFSFAKTLPVPGGGVLHLRDPQHAAAVETGERPGVYPFFGWLRKAVEREIKSASPAIGDWVESRLTQPLARSVRHAVGRPAAADMESVTQGITYAIGTPDGWHRWSISRVWRYLAWRANAEMIVARRRRNYRTVLAAVRDNPDLRPLQEILPDGCCPLYFPVWTESPRELHADLASHGIGASRWWAWPPHPVTPETDRAFDTQLRTCVVALPIHQGLDAVDMEKIAERLRRWRGP
jgi:dTDP-4-amino-4,6-dideoxygalactose transaminase